MDSKFLYSDGNIQKATRPWITESVEKFDSPIIGTLTFAYDVTAESAEKQLRRLHHKLSKYVFKNTYSRHKKMVRLVSFLEGFTNEEHHIHFIVDAHYKPVPDFIEKLNEFWIQGMRDVQPMDENLSVNWIEYISKLKSKKVFADSLLLNCMNL